MNRRGRPPHPDILTPREWEVLGLLREELTNEQIADRLGITERGARYHVSEILSKLGVSSRQEAADWHPEEAAPERTRLTRLRRWALAPLALKIAGAAFAGVAIIGATALALGVALTGGDDPASDSSAAELHPLIGADHWHAKYGIWICGELQPNLPKWDSGVDTHGDGYIYIHPQSPSEEGLGAALDKFFEYGGGELTGDTLQLPGSEATYHNGDRCPDGEEATVRVWVNGEQINDFSAYIPQDADDVVVSFGGSLPPSDPPVIGDRWLAKYDIWICGEHQPPLDAFSSSGEPLSDVHPVGILTMGDGLIHIEPAKLQEQGVGASLSKFFAYGGGALNQALLQPPGSSDFYHSGYDCPDDGENGSLKIWVKPGDPTVTTEFAPLDSTEFISYIPQDGDQIVISFGPVDEPNPQVPPSGTP